MLRLAETASFISVFTTFESRSCIELSKSCKARRVLPSRGVWGHAPSRNFEIVDSRRCIFQHCEAQNGMFRYLFLLNNPSIKTACLLLNRSKESNPKFERAFCDTPYMYLITDQMKINWSFLNSLFAWFMVTLTSLDISLILQYVIQYTGPWSYKRQNNVCTMYVVHYKKFTNILKHLVLIWNEKVQLEITDLCEICV